MLTAAPLHTERANSTPFRAALLLYQIKLFGSQSGPLQFTWCRPAASLSATVV